MSVLSKMARLTLLLTLFIAAAVIAALLVGFVAVLIVSLLGYFLSVSELQAIINLTALVPALAIIPIFLHGFFVTIKTKVDIKKWLTLTRDSLSTYYLRIAAVVLALGILGLLIFSLFQLLPQMLPLLLVELGLLAAAGIASIIFMYRFYRGFDTNSPKKKKIKRKEYFKIYAENLRASVAKSSPASPFKSNHSDPIGPHWDYIDPSGHYFRLMPDGSMVPK